VDRLLNFDPSMLKALMITLATCGKPATAARVSRAATIAYSIRSCPDSSLCRTESPVETFDNIVHINA
jgi:hypothetical protein